MSLSRLRRDHRGVAALEFVIVVPFLVLMYVIGTDVIMLLRNRFRIDQAAIQGTQVATQFTTLYDDDFTTAIFPVIQSIAGNGTVNVSTDPNPVACAATINGIDYPYANNPSDPNANKPFIVWQKSFSDSPCPANASNKVGRLFNTSTKTPVAPALQTYTPPPGMPFIVVEVASQYSLTGISATALGATQSQYSVAWSIPRLRALPPITTGTRP